MYDEEEAMANVKSKTDYKERKQIMKKQKKSFDYRKLKNNMQGITLITLVIIIIVLLILAGIALNLTIGQGGIFSRAEKAANTWRNAETNEQLVMREFSNWIDSVTPQQEEPISNDDLQISADNVYYADINDDGTVDGVIFADLAVGKSGRILWTI